LDIKAHSNVDNIKFKLCFFTENVLQIIYKLVIISWRGFMLN